MLKKLTRKLFTLFVLVAALTTVASAPASSTNRGMYCMYTVDDWGHCVMVCCSDKGDCSTSPCWVRTGLK